MKKILFSLLVLTSFILSGQKVFVVRYENQADIKVFSVKYASQADVKIYKVAYENQAGKND